MGSTSSDLFEELMFEAHRLGVVDELRELVSKMDSGKPHPTAYDMLPLYEEAMSQIKKDLTKS